MLYELVPLHYIRLCQYYKPDYSIISNIRRIVPSTSLTPYIKKKGWTSRYRENPALWNDVSYVRVSLALADSEHFRATGRAYALSCRPPVFHGYTLGVPHFPLSTALNAISLHFGASFCFCSDINPFAPLRSSRLLLF